MKRILLAIAMLGGCTTTTNQPREIMELNQATSSGLENLAKQTLDKVQIGVKNILAQEPTSVSFAASFGAYDRLRADLLETLHYVELVSLVSTDSALRLRAQETAVGLRQGLRDSFGEKFPAHMLVCAKHLANKIDANSEERRLIDFYVADFRREGAELSPEKLAQLRQLQSEISALALKFDANVQKDHRTITATSEQLAGVDPKLMASLSKDEKGRFILGTDYPTVFGILADATSSDIRRDVFVNFNNRAYPENYEVLRQLRVLRKELATLLGYPSFAHYDLANQMASSPAIVDSFLDRLQPTLQKNALEETKKLKSYVQKGDRDKKGRYVSWSMPYLSNQYTKKELSVDHAKIAEYFPVDATLVGLFDILKKQFDITVTIDPQAIGGWHPDVKVVEVSYDGKPRGRVFLDLYPREGKYTHGRVMILRPSSKQKGVIIPGEAAIITNFTPPLSGQPALFKFDEVKTLFHEFGHALHALMTETTYSFMDSGEMAVTYGLPVKTDFVELPSQMMELWLDDAGIVKDLSKHYLTGEKLSDVTVASLLQEPFASRDYLRQITLSRFALELFSSQEDIEKISAKRWKIATYMAPEKISHFPASFLHLTSYGAKYYSYLWTRVFAADMFEAFSKAGLMQSTALGRKYCAEVLAKGGSQPPEELLANFLGRPVNPDAFLQHFKKQ